MSTSPQQALAGIPGWQLAVVEELQGGHNNQTWLVTAGSQRAVLKIDAQQRRLPYNTRLAEQAIQNRAAESGIASPVIFASAGIYLTEYVAGRVWGAADIDNRDNLAEVADVLRRLHALPLTGRAANPVEAADIYCRTIDLAAPAIAHRCLAIIERVPVPGELRCCHNDLVAENMVATPGLRLLDWEYACDNDPLFDLATIVAHHNLAPEHSACLLDCYFDGDGARWRGRLQEQVGLYNALTWLWYASQPDPDPAQLAIFESRLS